MKNKKMSTIKLTYTAIFSALGMVLMIFPTIKLPFMPSFITFDFSDLTAIIVGFTYGPYYGLAVAGLKNFLHLSFSNTAGIGELSNFIICGIFVVVASLIYKYKPNRKGALISAFSGSILASAFSVLSNYFIIYPLFELAGVMPETAILSMYQTVLPSVENLWQALLIFNLPFTAVKELFVCLICFLTYKKLKPILVPKK